MSGRGPVIRPCDITPCSLVDHWLYGEGVAWLHHAYRFVLCDERGEEGNGRDERRGERESMEGRMVRGWW